MKYRTDEQRMIKIFAYIFNAAFTSSAFNAKFKT